MNIHGAALLSVESAPKKNSAAGTSSVPGNVFIKIGGTPFLIQDEETYYKELEEHGFFFFLSIDEDGYSEDVIIGSYPFGYGALYLYKHHMTNEIIAGFWQYS